MGTGKVVAMVAGIGLVAVGAGWFGQGMARKAVEGVVHDYILDHPEILPEAMERLQAKQTGSQLASVRQSVETPFPGAVLGNPRGSVTMVEFTDYACGYCRRSLPDVAELLKRNPDLRIVVRELPIIAETSPAAARMALAAAAQGRYAQFHDAMFAAGQIDRGSIEAAARSAGVDLVAAAKVAGSAPVEQELQRNFDLASKLGFSGTPSWIVGDRLIAGAVGVDQLAEAVEEARKAQGKNAPAG
ncbi:DsbA family protein [Novosphingobium colocasiae]|uniref:Outer membrane protein n=1 Tax=Novosphingobium colocasiae TaxID=1256513 RepID=A0A918P9E4_9SPHN|nr:DsbA family protein [Novosphingobium colocasiae]GGY92222.1 outer membrane protein [Novosphingobium colocasiae]